MVQSVGIGAALIFSASTKHTNANQQQEVSRGHVIPTPSGSAVLHKHTVTMQNPLYVWSRRECRHPLKLLMSYDPAVLYLICKDVLQRLPFLIFHSSKDLVCFSRAPCLWFTCFFVLQKSLWFGDLRHPLQAVRSYLIETCKTSDTLNNAEPLDKTLCGEAAVAL